MPKSSLTLFLWIAFYLVVSFAIGQSTQTSIDSWYTALEKPSFTPPNIVFPLMWSFLYITIACAGWRLWTVGGSKLLKTLFIIYTLLNWAWTPIFFGFQQIMGGLLWIAAVNIINFILIWKAWPHHRLVSYLMIPVFLWTLFAMVLSYQIWALNV